VETIHARLEDLLRTFFGDDSLVLTKTMRAGDVPGWDSLANVNLMFTLEEAFGIEFGDGELAVGDIGELAQLVARQVR
jgi:acyl carrier protein